MTETISTGQVATTGSRTYVVGSASGIDTSALVDAAYAQKTAPADKIDTKIETNENKITAYKELQTLAESLESSLEGLKSYSGYSTTDASVYSQKAAYTSVSDGSSLASLASISVMPEADNGTYTFEVLQLATAMTTLSSQQTSKTDALGYSGAFTLGNDNGASADISVTSDMSLSDIAKAINDSASGVKASVVRSSDQGYTLSLSTASTGQSLSYQPVSGDDVFAGLGITDTSSEFLNVTQQAQQAVIVLNGVEITSASNTFSDVVTGVSLTLAGAKPGTTVTLEVDYDYTSVKEEITSFIESYNALRDFVIANQQVNEDGSTAEDAALFSDSLLQSLNDELSRLITSMQSSSNVSTLRDMGITLDESNKLVISDEDALNSALLNNYSAVQSFFQSSITTSTDNLGLLRNTSSASSMEFTLDIEMDGLGNITAASVGGNADLFDISGTVLTGKAGTAYSGLVFVYAGTTSASIDVSLQQGLADRMTNTLDRYTNATSGQLQSEVSNLQQSNDDMALEADRIRERAESYRDSLIARYAQMESDIEAADLLLQQVRAILGTSDDDE